MSINYVIAVEGLDALRFMDDVPKSIKNAALRAVNKTVRDGRVMVSREIRKQVALTATYLGPSQGRLEAIPAKSTDSLEGRIRARTRPTSLARFTKDRPLAPGQRRRAQGIKLTVKPGVARYLANAFVVPLRSGGDGALGNLGLAIRSETKPAGAYKPKRLGKNLWLLYGPSISQVFYSARNPKGSGVAEEVAPELALKLEAEFSRLIAADLA
jgi:hypothetical protein